LPRAETADKLGPYQSPRGQNHLIHDHLIVGGGSAGCVLANRLSARASNRVLLVEAGPDTPPGRVPPEILDSYPGTVYFDPRYHWTRLRVRTVAQPHNAPPAAQKTSPYEQARVLGGGSSINGQFANRGAPGDYDEWAARGATGWHWNAVLPYFKRVERDLDFAGPLHGTEGLIPIRRIFPMHWCGHAKAIGEACAEAGFPYVPDQNGDFAEGYFPVAISNTDDHRVSTAIGYLDATTRARPNLDIITETEVLALLFDGQRCIGVRARANGVETDHLARETILSAGAIHTPALLLRAGIGPAPDLQRLGIAPRAHLPGVGQRMMDHPSISLAAYIRPEARLRGRTRRHMLVALRFSSGHPDAPPCDMAMDSASKSAWHAIGDRIGTMFLFVNKPFSEAGEIRLASPDPGIEPEIDFNLLADRRDLDRLVAGFRRLGAMQQSAAMRAATDTPFPASYSDRVRKIGTVTARNRILTALAAPLLDGPARLRRAMIDHVLGEGFRFEDVMHDDAATEAFVRHAVIGTFHVSCSCRMGAADDPMAVTDPHGRVRLVSGLRIADASLFPAIPRANTNLPVLMVAEKLADEILTESTY
jgi:5-(hydroxymethyl)furfural/furfural oxidase